MEKEEKLESALLKVALGYQIAEITEEYAEVDGELKLTKRKKTKKDVPPDLRAVQMLLANDATYAVMTDEELEQEKERLLACLQLEEGKEKLQKEGGKSKTKAKSKTKTTGKTKKAPAKKKTTKKGGEKA